MGLIIPLYMINNVMYYRYIYVQPELF